MLCHGNGLHENIVEQVWHTKQGVFRRKRQPDVRDHPMRGQQKPLSPLIPDA